MIPVSAGAGDSVAGIFLASGMRQDRQRHKRCRDPIPGRRRAVMEYFAMKRHNRDAAEMIRTQKQTHTCWEKLS